MFDLIAYRIFKSFCPVSDMSSNVGYIKYFNAVLARIDANFVSDLSIKTLSHVARFPAFTSIGNSPRTWAWPL